MARQPTATQRAFTAPAREVLRKGEKAKDSSAGAMVLLIMEQMPNTQPRMVPARGPSRIAPRMTGMWVVVALMMGSWIMPRGVLASRMTMAAIMATPTIQWVSCLRVFIFNYLLLPLFQFRRCSA